MSSKQLSIFISSKMQELAPERKVLQALIPTLDAGMVKLSTWVFEQDAPASNVPIRQVYLNALKNSALYIGLFWNEYGAWTIDEFEHATEWGIDRHIYVKDVDSQKRDQRLSEFLNQQSHVISGITPKWFSTSEELCEQVKKSIQVWLQDWLLKRPGDTSAIFAEISDDIPEQPTKLVGRDALLAEARSLLEEHSRVLLQGFGGMGKTALAAALAARWIDDGKGSVLWLRTGTENASTIFEALASPFNARQAIASATGNARATAVRSMLTESGATLLVLDDVWDGTSLNQVLRAIPRDLALLVTSRQRYALDEILEIGKLDEQDALRLLGHYARQNYSDDDNARELCRQVGYHAFALEIAGKTIKVDKITPLDLLRRIAGTPHDIAMPEDFAEEGRTSIKELLDASLNALDHVSRSVFLAFGTLFVPSATPELLARYMELEKGVVGEALVTLQRRGLAEQVKPFGESGAYYRIHDLAFSYARTLSANLGTRRGDICQVCREFAIAHENDLELLEAELGNIFGAAEAARDVHNHVVLIDIVRALIGRYLSARGHNSRFLELLDAAISATEQIGPEQDETRHYLLSKRGNAYYDRGALADALKCYEEALRISRHLKLPAREVILMSVIGRVQSDQGSPNATNTLNQAYQIASNLQDEFLIGFVLDSQGYHAQAVGDYEATRQIYAQEVELARRIEDNETLFFALVNLGSAENKLGEFSMALDHHVQALGIARSQDNRMWVAYALQSIAEDQHHLGAHAEAQQAFREALALFREGGMKAKIAEVMTYMQEANYPPA